MVVKVERAYAIVADQNIHNPDGRVIPAQDSMLYLGATLHGNGKFGCEIGRKIGAATADFNALKAVWKHASITKARKIQLFDALIQSNLRYSIASVWLLKSDLRRLVATVGWFSNTLRAIDSRDSLFLFLPSHQQQCAKAGVLATVFEHSARNAIEIIGAGADTAPKESIETIRFPRRHTGF